MRRRAWAASLLTSALLPLAAGFAVAGQQAQGAENIAAEDATVTLPDGRGLHLKCAGEGSPMVILDAGLGLDSSIWSRVQPGLAAITRTCAYDRAGYGRSTPGPLPRNAANRTSDLLGLLEALRDEGPFILVSHSAAESPARLAAMRRADLVAGLVLVDPGPDLETLRRVGPIWAAAHDAGQAAASTCIRATAAGEMRPGAAVYVECGSPPLDGPLASRAMATAVLSENEPDPAGPDEAPVQGGLGDLPVIVLTAENKFGTREGAAPAETPHLRRAWSQAGAGIAASSTRGEQRIVPNAAHVIQFEQPQTVTDAVRDVVRQVRAGRGPAS